MTNQTSVISELLLSLYFRRLNVGLITKTLSSLATQAYGKFRWEL